MVLKVIGASVWETSNISIGGKNPTDVNFAIIQNQYFQQNLASLADSMTELERQNVQKNCRRFLAEKLLFFTEEQENWVLDDN